MSTENDNSNPQKWWLATIASLAVGGSCFWMGSLLSQSNTVELTDALFIFSALRLAPIIALVAVVAFALNNRAMFLFGTIGALSGPIIIHTYTTGRYLSYAQMNAEQWQFVGFFGSVLCCTATYAWQRRTKPFRFQFSIGFLILLLTAVAFLLAMWRGIAA